MRLRLQLHEVYMLFTCYLLEFHFTYTESTIIYELFSWKLPKI